MTKPPRGSCIITTRSGFISASQRGAETIIVRDPSCGLVAAIVLDDETLGPAAGGIRTRAYPDLDAAIADASALAAAMTVKCALAGLSAGGGKGVVMDHPGLDRPRAFRVLGERIQALGGRFRTAGDLGTQAADLAAMASVCDYIHTDEPNLAASVGHGLLRCLEAIGRVSDRRLDTLSVAIQGCGAIGRAVAEALAPHGVQLVVADIDTARAEAVAKDTQARVVAPSAIASAEVDVYSPCAIGGSVTADVVASMRAWALCGAANNIVANRGAETALMKRQVVWVPDVIASAGAVADGIGRTVMGLQLQDRTALIDALGCTAESVLREAKSTGRSSQDVASALAAQRLGRPS